MNKSIKGLILAATLAVPTVGCVIGGPTDSVCCCRESVSGGPPKCTTEPPAMCDGNASPGMCGLGVGVGGGANDADTGGGGAQ